MATGDNPRGTAGPRERLVGKLSSLDEAACQVIETYVDALRLPWQEDIVASSDIVTEAFARHFRTRLQLHHATNEEVFNKKSFEFAFKQASMAAGRQAVIETSSVNPGHDITVDGVRISLKTEAETKISRRSVKISKFMEARWIRDCKTGEEFQLGSRRVLAHMKNYERVFVLTCPRFMVQAL